LPLQTSMFSTLEMDEVIDDTLECRERLWMAGSQLLSSGVGSSFVFVGIWFCTLRFCICWSGSVWYGMYGGGDSLDSTDCVLQGLFRACNVQCNIKISAGRNSDQDSSVILVVYILNSTPVRKFRLFGSMSTNATINAHLVPPLLKGSTPLRHGLYILGLSYDTLSPR
jgi:hypothetical protein